MLLPVSYSFINIFLCKSLSYCTCMNIHFVFIERLNIVALLVLYRVKDFTWIHILFLMFKFNQRNITF